METYKYSALIRLSNNKFTEFGKRVSTFSNEKTTIIIKAINITEARAKAWNKGIVCSIKKL